MICPFEDSSNNAERGRVFRGSSPKKLKHSSLWLVNVYHLLVSAEIFAHILHYSSPNDLKTCFWSNHLWVVATLQWHRETQQVIHGRLGRLAIFIPHTQAHKTTHVFISDMCQCMWCNAMTCVVMRSDMPWSDAMYVYMIIYVCFVNYAYSLSIFFNDCFMLFGNLGGKMMTPQCRQDRKILRHRRPLKQHWKHWQPDAGVTAMVGGVLSHGGTSGTSKSSILTHFKRILLGFSTRKKHFGVPTHWWKPYMGNRSQPMKYIEVLKLFVDGYS